MLENSSYGKVDIKMKKFITNNVGLKILSFVIAFLLWLIVNVIDDPVKETDFKNIKINIVNVNKIEAQSTSVHYNNDTVTVKVKGRRSELEKMKSNELYAEANMEEYFPLTKSVRINAYSTRKSVDIVSIEPPILKIELEKILKKSYPVDVKISGDTSYPYKVDDENIMLDQNNIEITGQESKLKKINKVIIPVNLDKTVKSDRSIRQTPKVYDIDGEEITGLKLGTVKVMVPILKRATIPVIQKTEGKLAEGYVLDNIILSSEEVKIIGKEKLIDTINNIELPSIDISKLTENETVEVDIQELLKDGVKLESYDIIKVELQVEKLQQKNITVPYSRIIINNLTDEYTLKYTNEGDMSFVVSGLQSKVNLLTSMDIKCSLDLKDLKEGKYTLPVQYQLPEDIELVSNIPKVEIELVGRE